MTTKNIHQLRGEGNRIAAFVQDAQTRVADPAPVPASAADIAAAKRHRALLNENPFQAAQFLVREQHAIVRGREAIRGTRPTESGVIASTEPPPPRAA